MTDIEVNNNQIALDRIDRAISRVSETQSRIGAYLRRLELQDGFFADVTATLDSSLGRLVDADLAEESARLVALQTRQQLSLQITSISSRSARTMMLSLLA